jgi:hypothetical protein
MSLPMPKGRFMPFLSLIKVSNVNTGHMTTLLRAERLMALRDYVVLSQYSYIFAAFDPLPHLEVQCWIPFLRVPCRKVTRC